MIVNVKPVAVDVRDDNAGVVDAGKSLIAVVATESSADDDPRPFVAMTDTLMNLSTSSSVNTYVLELDAEPMFEYAPPVVDARFH